MKEKDHLSCKSEEISTSPKKKDHQLWSKPVVEQVMTFIRIWYRSNYYKASKYFPIEDDLVQSVLLDLFKQNGYLSYNPELKSFKNYIMMICWRHVECELHRQERRNQVFKLKYLDEDLNDENFSLLDTIPSREDLSGKFLEFIDMLNKNKNNVASNFKAKLSDIFLDYAKEGDYEVLHKKYRLNYNKFSLDMFYLNSIKTEKHFNSEFFKIQESYGFDPDKFEKHFDIFSRRVDREDYAEKTSELLNTFYKKMQISTSDIKNEVKEIVYYIKNNYHLV